MNEIMAFPHNTDPPKPIYAKNTVWVLFFSTSMELDEKKTPKKWSISAASGPKVALLKLTVLRRSRDAREPRDAAMPDG